MAQTRNEYIVPLPEDAITARVDVTTSGSHEGAYEGSIDYAVPLGTAVLAAQDGVIRRVRDDSERYGKTPDFGHDVNYITIEHAHHELSEYLHLAKNSAKVQVGDTVKAGQEIAKTGLSGWLFAPHLHLMVYLDKADFQCLEIQFKT